MTADFDLAALTLLDDDFMAILAQRLNLFSEWELEGVTRPRRGTTQRTTKSRVASELEDRPFPSDTPWRDLGLCQRVEGDWFDIPSGGLDRQLKAKNLELMTCQACEVLEECGEYAEVTKQPYGIWGGVLPRDRLKTRRRR